MFVSEKKLICQTHELKVEKGCNLIVQNIDNFSQNTITLTVHILKNEIRISSTLSIFPLVILEV